MIKVKTRTLVFILPMKIFIDNKIFELQINFINRSIIDISVDIRILKFVSTERFFFVN